MPRHCFVPEELKSGPFSLAQARALGLTRDNLRASEWRRVAHGWYRWAGCPDLEEVHLTAIAPSLPQGGAFCGVTAARLFGLDVPAPRRPEVVVPEFSGVASRVEATVRRRQLDARDVVQVRGFPVTSPARTCFDLAAQPRLVEAVVAVDMALHAGLVTLDTFTAYVAAHRGVQGVVQARRVLNLAEPKTESPMESRLRLAIVLGGLPRPEAQVALFDAAGAFVARVDLYYPEARLAIEYDGENHRERLVSDDRRQNRLQQVGVSLLRYTAPDLTDRRVAILAEVSAALRAASSDSPFLGKGGLQRAG